MEARDNITHQIKEAVRKSETKTFRSMETVWNRIEEKLDEEEQKKGKVIPFRKISIAAAVLLLLSLGAIYVFLSGDPKQDNEQIYVHQVNDGIKPLTPEVNTSREIAKEINMGKVTPESPVVYTKPRQRKVKRGAVQKDAVASYIDINAVRIKDQSLEKNQELLTAPKTIKGIVTDDQGEGIAGAVVSVKGTRNSTLTDVNGNYEIVVSNGREELEIRGVGLISKTVDISKSEYVLATTLETDNAAVVAITIYDQEKDKKSFTGMVSSITSKKTSKRPVTDISRALEGEVPGVQITHVGARSGASDIVVRGISVSGISGSPLIVIDGAYYNGTTVSMSSDEVESLTILKDGNATSVYGSKGVNGVIVIKTKNGKGYSEPKENIFQKMKSVFNKKDKKESEESEE
jgi:Ca-activated chloride channel family protein